MIPAKVSCLGRNHSEPAKVSCLGRNHSEPAKVAQLVEHSPEEGRVTSSILVLGTNGISKIKKHPQHSPGVLSILCVHTYFTDAECFYYKNKYTLSSINVNSVYLLY